WSGSARRGLRYGQAAGAAVIQWVGVVRLRFFIEELLQFSELVGVLGGQIVRLAEVLVEIVELPLVVLPVSGCEVLSPGERMLGAGDPALVVNRTVREDLEILSLA